ncbi:replicative helicase loader/inhibitor [Aquibacillus kalidii]|uniref:replicative helicase loader/inhibitor n=1 Tax=Aquibacillus kalidii TaxID=2762597 RepID=UPI001647D32C|nr:replicative helicase loader/inhibitor [Aquibacillus kalidii]
MTHDEAVDVLETIAEVYPRYELTKKKAAILLPQLKQMDYQLVLAKLSAYVADHPFAPTIAEIAAYPAKQNEHIRLINQWKQEAENVPQETKQAFQLQMKRLVDDHG